MEDLEFGSIHLKVVELERSIKFWTEQIGLILKSKENKVAKLGTETTELVILYEEAKTVFSTGFSSLYHLAIHIPTEEEFARILKRLIHNNYPISPTDHIMHKAIYLEDPDGITVEIVFETPERFGQYNMGAGFSVIDSEGTVRGATEALDVNLVLATLHDNDLGKSIPSDSYIGHLHLYVNDLKRNYDHYESIGFTPNLFANQFQFADMGANGIFKHRIAFNTWTSLGAEHAPEEMAGMKYFELKINDKKKKDAILNNESLLEKEEYGILVTDPSGSKFKLTD